MELPRLSISTLFTKTGVCFFAVLFVAAGAEVRGQAATSAGWAFAPPLLLPALGGPQDLLLADVNQNGFLDLLVARTDVNLVQLYTNDGTGSFVPGPAFATAQRPARILLADVDQNGIPDLLVAHALFGSADLRYLPATAPGVFGAPVTISSPLEVQDMAVGDWDLDGNPDIVVASALAGQLRFFFSSTGITFGIPLPLGGTPTGLGTGDLTGNGTLEVAVSMIDGSLRVLTADPAVPWTFQFVPAIGGSGGALAMADLNGDGLVDVVMANQTSNSISIFWNAGGGLLIPGVLVPAGLSPRHVLPADFDRDGLADIAVAESGQNTVTVFRNGPAGTFAPAAVLTGGVQTRRLAAGSTSPGAPPDLLGAATVSNQIRHHRHAAPSLATVAPLNPGAAVSIHLRCVPSAGFPFVSALALGSSPGMPLPDGRTIPLNMDALLFFTLQPGNPVFQGGSGTLGAGGLHAAQLWVPPDPALVGLAIAAAFVVLDPAAASGVGPISPPLLLTVQ